MKPKLMKLIGVLVLACGLTAQAAVESITITGASTTNNLVFTQAVKVVSIQISSGDAAAKGFRFIDSPDSSAIYTNAAYTTIVQYATNYVRVFTNFSGIVISNTNAAIYTAALTVDENTARARNTQLEVNVAAGSTYTFTNANGLFFNFGLLFTNQLMTNSSVTITYLPAL